MVNAWVAFGGGQVDRRRRHEPGSVLCGRMGEVIVRVRTIVAGLALAAGAFAGLSHGSPARAAAGVDPELRNIYRQILRNPTDVALNLRYAALAERKGLLRKALAAYQRVLMQDPRNAEARSSLTRVATQLEPDFSAVYLQLGARYATNLRQRPGGDITNNDDFIGDTRLIVRDERRLGGLRWRTLGQLYADLHAETRNLDFGHVGASTGPLLGLGGDWRLRPAVGAAFAWLDRKVFFTELSGQLGFEAVGGGLLRRVDIRLGYQFMGKDYAPGRDGIVFEVAPTFAIHGVAKDGDNVTVRPRYRWNNATGRNADPAFVQGDIFPERYHEIGGDARYLAPFMDGRIYLGPTIEGNVRYYRSNVPGGSSRRHDVYLRPGVQLIVPNAFVNGHTLTLQYQHERNVSNASGKGFSNHVVGIRSIWRLY